MDKNPFDSLYNDLFGGSVSGGNKKDGASGPEMPDFPSIDLSSQEDALKHAEEALKEARELLDGVPELDSFLKPAIKEPPKEEKADGPAPAPVQEEPVKKEEETDPMEDLDTLIGLTTIKHDVKELADFVKIQKLRKDQGMKAVPVSLHLVFTGNPGTGKTTVARILSRIYRQIGVLSKGQLVEVDRSGLVAGYVGQTAIKTQEKIQEALGGILFIDEAYSLAQKDDAFGQESIDTILKAMEDHRDDFVVIVAGYTGPMEKFINSNPGLKSRFNKYIEFPDYTLDELDGIFDLNCKKYEYQIDEDARRQIREMIKARMISRHENFANAREVRNLFEDIITNQARRVAAMEEPSPEDIRRVILEDLYEAEEKPETKEKTETEEENELSEIRESLRTGTVMQDEEKTGSEAADEGNQEITEDTVPTEETETTDTEE